VCVWFVCVYGVFSCLVRSCVCIVCSVCIVCVFACVCVRACVLCACVDVCLRVV